ncbi:hypothetical protein Cs7R123_36420 [Catellatospora sp. TT07R-123]|nr:hypothetical protein [Catellatospora sp. TT07R-123]GHJ46300.1 hypothetical protein Cs7R123_36420 [Catellatospora sp. TT07R-123]
MTEAALAIAAGTDVVPPPKAILLFLVCAGLGWYLGGRYRPHR